MILRDRTDAARRLSDQLRHHAGSHPLILAIPRGAVPMGRHIADALDGELDVVLVRKLGSPGDPETAIGSVDEHGEVVLDRRSRHLGYTDDYLERETERRLAELRQRARLYRQDRPASDPAGRTVIVVDDGAATGATLTGAIRLLRQHRPARLVVAVAVAPRRVLRHLRRLADEVICLHRPWIFFSVSQAFRSFRPVDDDQVRSALRAHR